MRNPRFFRVKQRNVEWAVGLVRQQAEEKAATPAIAASVTAVDRGHQRSKRPLRPPTPAASARRRAAAESPLTIAVSMEALRAANTTGQGRRRAAQIYRKRAPGVVEGGGQRMDRIRNTFYADMYASVDFAESPDGGATRCCDDTARILRGVRMTGRRAADVAHLLFNGDAGQSSLKLICLIRYADDPIVQV